MPKMKFALSTIAVALLISAGTLAATTTTASAYMACSGGDCWHTDKKVRAPGVQFDYHPDDWYFHQTWDGNNANHYRDYHEGRGYYKSGIWITL